MCNLVVRDRGWQHDNNINKDEVCTRAVGGGRRRRRRRRHRQWTSSSHYYRLSDRRATWQGGPSQQRSLSSALSALSAPSAWPSSSQRWLWSQSSDDYNDYDYDHFCCSLATGDDKRDNGGKENGTVKHDKDDVNALGPLPPMSNNLADDKRHNKGGWATAEGYGGEQEGEGGVGQHCAGASRKNIKTKLTFS